MAGMLGPASLRRSLEGRRILLGVTAGIAAYKAIQVARDLTLHGAAVDVVLTRSAREFVGPVSFEALTGRPAHVELYVAGDPLTHIRLAREAELIVVAPATADFLARASAGMADDLLTAVLLATRAPVLACPAMNDRMYSHPLTTSNLARLREIGWRTVGPDSGPLAWSEGEGEGRMVEPARIVAEAARALGGDPAMHGRRVLVTAGPTREAVDPVRFLGNRSSGRMGYAVAAAAWRRGAEVTLVSGPSGEQAPAGVEILRVETTQEMLEAVSAHLPAAELLVMAAAPADFRPAAPAAQKIKKAGGAAPIDLEPTPDILLETRAARAAGSVIVGFAVETEALLEGAREKLDRKALDLLVLNDPGEAGAGFEVATNRVSLVDRDGGTTDLPLLSKEEVAERILDRAADLLPRRHRA
jgi:phosphopantothenoylcysteine decarboxylase / phosphopantothenate---cysteine ligase